MQGAGNGNGEGAPKVSFSQEDSCQNMPYRGFFIEKSFLGHHLRLSRIEMDLLSASGLHCGS